MAGLDRPAPINVGPLVCRAKRPPTARKPKWEWRILTRGRGGAQVDSGRWTEQEVMLRAAEIIAAGELPAPAPVTIKTAPQTVAELLGAHAAAVYVDSTRHEPSTLANVKRCMKHLRGHLGDVPLAGVSRETIAHYVKLRSGEKAAGSTIIKEWVILATAWKYGRQNLWVSGELPDHGIKHTRPVYCHTTPSEDEVEQVITYLQVQSGKRKNGAHWPAVGLLIAHLTGARVGEVESLRWEDFDAANKRLTLHGKKKNDGSDGDRTIPIPERLVRTLQEWQLRQGRPDGDELLLGCSDGMLRSRGTDKISKACKALKIKRFTWHGVRRRVVRRYRQGGISIKAAATLLGHSPVVMLRLYDEIEDGDLEGELSKLYGS